MHGDILKGQWKQIRGEMKRWWGKLTDDDLDVIEGDRDKLLGALQKRYGYEKDRAESELNRRLSEYEKAQPTPSR